MKKTLLTAVSAFAIMAITPAHADTMKPGSQEAADSSTGSLSQDAEKAWENTKKDFSHAAENASETIEDAYHDAEQAINDSSTQATPPVAIDQRMTAKGMIGQPVYNMNGDRVAKIEDIILDNNGDATMVILGDGDFTGLGKTVAFDYDVLTRRSSNGDVITALTEEMIDNAANFSYDPADRNADVQVVPSNGLSVAALLDGEVVNPQGETLAEIDNLVLRNGQATEIIVAFGQVLGMGGEQAALEFNQMDLKRNDDSIDFQLSSNETLDFNTYKKTAMN